MERSMTNVRRQSFIAPPNVMGFNDADLFFVRTQDIITPREHRKIGETHLVWALCEGDNIKIALPQDDRVDTANLKQWTRSQPELVELPVLGYVQ